MLLDRSAVIIGERDPRSDDGAVLNELALGCMSSSFCLLSSAKLAPVSISDSAKATDIHWLIRHSWTSVISLLARQIISNTDVT